MSRDNPEVNQENEEKAAAAESNEKKQQAVLDYLNKVGFKNIQILQPGEAKKDSDASATQSWRKVESTQQASTDVKLPELKDGDSFTFKAKSSDSEDAKEFQYTIKQTKDGMVLELPKDLAAKQGEFTDGESQQVKQLLEFSGDKPAKFQGNFSLDFANKVLKQKGKDKEVNFDKANVADKDGNLYSYDKENNQFNKIEPKQDQTSEMNVGGPGNSNS